MNPEEIREKLARFMGWTQEPWGHGCGSPTWAQEYFLQSSGAILEGEDPSTAWEPDTDRNQTALLLEKVAEKGLQIDFLEALDEIGEFYAPLSRCSLDDWDKFEYQGLFALFTASPETICKAILKVIEKEPTQ